MYRPGHVYFHLSYSAIQWKWSNNDIGPYSVQGMLTVICLIQPYGGNCQIMTLVPTVYMAHEFQFVLFSHTVEMVGI